MKTTFCALFIAIGFSIFGEACCGQGGRDESFVLSLTPNEFREAGLEKLTAAELMALDDAISRRRQPQGRRNDLGKKAPKRMEDLLDGYILADNGEYLGLISTDEFNSKSLLNDLGPHGNDISPNSILNDIGIYGSDISPQSAFNDIAMSPPRVFTKDGVFVGFLTTNDLKKPRIDPRALLGWLRSQ